MRERETVVEEEWGEEVVVRGRVGATVDLPCQVGQAPSQTCQG